MRLLALSAAGLMTIALAGCNPLKGTSPPNPPRSYRPLRAMPSVSMLQTSPEITGADIAARVKELADDKYEGRGPGDPSRARKPPTGSPPR